MGEVYLGGYMDIILWIWQLPQHIVGLVLRLLYARGAVDREYRGTKIRFNSKFPSGICLGRYIILRQEDEVDIKHEYGHSCQSLYLGPLYLLVIGLSSSLGSLYDRLFHRKWPNKDANRWYYNQPWEAWADRLGGVVRKY